MPELGKYATEVLAAYGVSLALILGLVWVSLTAHRRAKAAVKEAERG